MPKTIEIKMTTRGYDVTTGGRTTNFCCLEDAVDFARTRFERAQAIQDLAARID
jgi:hypothetical protein